MKKLLITLLALFAITRAKAQQPLNTYQTICYIEYKYDNAGNRISRTYECGDNPLYGSDHEEVPGGTGSGAGISRLANPKKITENAIVFPNPTTGVFYVKLAAEKSECVVEIKDLNGKLLKQEHITQFDKGIDISRFANGQYFINIITGNNKEILKLIKNEND